MYLNDLVKRRRQQLGISQAKLAKMLGVSTPQYISNIELNRCKLPKKKLKRICRALLIDKKVVADAMLADYANELCAYLGVGLPHSK